MDDMTFENQLKGHIAATMLKIALTKAGYRVRDFGVETRFDQLAHQSGGEFKAAYENIDILDKRRPDLWVVSKDEPEPILIEVKYSSFLKKNGNRIYETAAKQRHLWPKTDFVVFRGDPLCEPIHYDSMVRFIRGDQLKHLKDVDSHWDRFDTLSDRFKRLAEVKNLNKIVPVIQALRAA